MPWISVFNLQNFVILFSFVQCLRIDCMHRSLPASISYIIDGNHLQYSLHVQVSGYFLPPGEGFRD